MTYLTIQIFLEKNRKNVLTKAKKNSIINELAFKADIDKCEHAGTGRQARLRGVCLWRVGSSPTARTIYFA